jgi:uncharacterized protein
VTYALVLAVGYLAGIVSGVVGTGATVVLLPILVVAFGPREAVPIMAVVALMSNVAKIATWWREVDWRACGVYALGGAPAAALGAHTLLVLPEKAVEIGLGLFFLAMVPGRRWLATHHRSLGLPGLAGAGAVIGFLTGIVVSTGPLSVPAFAAYGLVKGAFIATEAAGSLALYVSKALAFRQFGALPDDILVKGLISGSAVMAGNVTARLIVDRLSIVAFHHLLDGVMVVAALVLLWTALA